MIGKLPHSTYWYQIQRRFVPADASRPSLLLCLCTLPSRGQISHPCLLPKHVLVGRGRFVIFRVFFVQCRLGLCMCTVAVCRCRCHRRRERRGPLILTALRRPDHGHASICCQDLRVFCFAHVSRLCRPFISIIRSDDRSPRSSFSGRTLRILIERSVDSVLRVSVSTCLQRAPLVFVDPRAGIFYF